MRMWTPIAYSGDTSWSFTKWQSFGFGSSHSQILSTLWAVSEPTASFRIYLILFKLEYSEKLSCLHIYGILYLIESFYAYFKINIETSNDKVCKVILALSMFVK